MPAPPLTKFDPAPLTTMLIAAQHGTSAHWPWRGKPLLHPGRTRKKHAGSNDDMPIDVSNASCGRTSTQGSPGIPVTYTRARFRSPRAEHQRIPPPQTENSCFRDDASHKGTLDQGSHLVVVSRHLPYKDNRLRVWRESSQVQYLRPHVIRYSAARQNCSDLEPAEP